MANSAKEYDIKFFLELNPPTATAQEKKVAMIGGKPIVYKPPKVKQAEKELMALLSLHKPKEPLQGAVELYTVWRFPKGKKHKNGEWRTTKPDTDNLQKLLKDCMTKCRFWNDDAQVCRETVAKIWSDEDMQGIFIEILPLEDKTNEA